MNTRMHTAVALGALGLSMFFCHAAKACGASGVSGDAVGMPVALIVDGSPTSLLQALPGMVNPLQEQEPITGLYRFTFTAKGNQGIPDGTVLDQGFTVWHADGTEIMNSGRAPISQSFCLGVWTRTGPKTYRLNHWAMSWDPTGKTYIGPANIREYVRLDRDGDSYSGKFTLIQFATDGKTRLGQVQGSVMATRVTPDGG